MKFGRTLAAYSFALMTFSGVAFASGVTSDETSISADLSSLKTDIVSINREITQLENELLFPSSETAILVSVEQGSSVRLVDINVTIDDKNAGHQFYSDQEFAALAKGGIQRIYAGNLTSGQHVLKAHITGYDPTGRDFTRTVTHTFVKTAKRKIIEIKAADNAARTQSEFRFREWDTQ